MDYVEDHDDPKAWPPGTVRIEALLGRNQDKEIILQPRPSSDPNDPLNWPMWRKHWNFALTCYYSLMVFALVNAVTPTWGPMQDQLGFSLSILNDSYAIGCGTLAFGAFLLIPFALKYGRRPVYIFSTFIQFGISVWSARIFTVADLMLVNVFECLVGALAEVIVQMTVADVYFTHQRGKMNTIYVWISNAGGYLAPLAAGYVTISEGWRWVWWWIAIFLGLGGLVFIFTYEETKYSNPTMAGLDPNNLRDPLAEVERRQSVVQQEKTEESMTVAGDVTPDSQSRDEEAAETTIRKMSVVHIDPMIPRKTYRERLAIFTPSHGDFSMFLRHSYQPVQILCTIPAVAYMSLVYGVMLAWSTVMTTTLSGWMILPPYNFTAAQIGLMSLPPFIGSTIGSLVCGPLSDWVILWLARRNKGIYEPEMRLWVMAPFLPFAPAGAFMFGIGLNNGASWPVLAVGYAICSFGTTPISSIALTYITDSYTEIVGDALVGVTFTRNALATIFVFALTPWINGVGMKNVFITIGVIGIAVLSFAFVFIAKGKQFRIWTAPRYRYFAERQFDARKV